MVTSADVPSAHVIAFLADKKKPSSAPPSSLQPQIPLHPPAGEQALPGSRNVGFTEQEIKLEAIESAITVETPVPGEQPDLRPVDSGAAKTPSETLAESAKKLAQQPPGPPEKFSLEVGKIHASMEKTNLKLKQVELELANLDIDVKRHEAEISAAKELRKEVKQGSKSDKNGKYLLDKMEEAKEKIAEGGSKKKELLKDKTILEAQLAKTLANLEIVVQNKGAYTDAQWDYAWALIERGESLAGRQKVLPTGKDITLSKPRMELASRNIEELLANLDRPTRDLVASLVPSSVPGGLRKEALENARTIRDQLLAGGQPVDVATGNAMVGLWEPDHLVSRNTIATDPRFQYLTPSQQREMLVGVAENMFPLAKELNGQKGDLTMAEWIDMRKVNNEPIYFENDLREAYRRAWDAVDRKFVELLGAERGKPPVRAE
jgi:hypothetical protein